MGHNGSCSNLARKWKIDHEQTWAELGCIQGTQMNTAGILSLLWTSFHGNGRVLAVLHTGQEMQLAIAEGDGASCVRAFNTAQERQIEESGGPRGLLGFKTQKHVRNI